MPDGEVEVLHLEEYLVGVVAAEMPAEFEREALKAQAVAARTYAALRLSHPTTEVGYDVDTTVKSQAWLSKAQMQKKWGWFAYWGYHARIEAAVKSTRGQVLVANGEYIDALFFSSAGRKPTERAEEVWSSSRAYLQNVSSGEENPLRFVKQIAFTPAELYQLLKLEGAARSFIDSDFKVLSRTTTDRVMTVSLLGRTYKATELRVLLGLPSTDLEWVVAPNQITITAYGNGHAVGMSQYGANDMARQGLTYPEILAHFYPGVKLLTLTQKTE